MACSIAQARLSRLEGVPEEFRIFPMGEVQTSKGTFLFDKKAAESVLAAYEKHGVDLYIDYDHSAAKDSVDKSVAAGWFSLELREDGLWAVDITWTPAGKAHLESREYRYFSPFLYFDPKTKRVTELLNLALTNMPATHEQTPLVADNTPNPTSDSGRERPLPPTPVFNEEPPMKDRLPTVLAALGLPADADESIALSAINRHKGVGEQLVSLCNAKSPSEALGMVVGALEKATKYDVLSKEHAKLQADIREAALSGQIDKAIEDGKLEPAKRQFAETLAKKLDNEGFKAYIDSLTSSVNTSGGTNTPAPAQAGPTSGQAEVFESLGMTPEQRKAALAASGNGGG